MSRPAGRLEDRFWAKVDKGTPNECWVWTGCKGSRPFAYGYLGKYVDGKWKRVNAAKISWEIFHNKRQPEGTCICHTCDNPPCVRPDHLYLGDKQTNARDCVNRGRRNSPKGENTWDAKLTWEKVREIRNLYSSRGGSYRKGRVSERTLAKQFNVSRIAIRKVLSHQTWKESYVK